MNIRHEAPLPRQDEIVEQAELRQLLHALGDTSTDVEATLEALHCMGGRHGCPVREYLARHGHDVFVGYTYAGGVVMPGQVTEYILERAEREEARMLRELDEPDFGEESEGAA